MGIFNVAIYLQKFQLTGICASTCLHLHFSSLFTLLCKLSFVVVVGIFSISALLSCHLHVQLFNAPAIELGRLGKLTSQQSCLLLGAHSRPLCCCLFKFYFLVPFSCLLCGSCALSCYPYLLLVVVFFFCCFFEFYYYSFCLFVSASFIFNLFHTYFAFVVNLLMANARKMRKWTRSKKRESKRLYVRLNVCQAMCQWQRALCAR